MKIKRSLTLTQVSADTFAKTSRYDKANGIDREYELIVYRNYVPATSDQFAEQDAADFYRRKEFNSNRS